MIPTRIRALATGDDTDDFSCGDPGLDRFLHAFALDNQTEHHIGVTYVLVHEGDIAHAVPVLGFVTLVSAATSRDHLGDAGTRLPRYPLPALRLARLGVDERHQRKGLGRLLVRFGFHVALQQSVNTGCVAVLVDAAPVSVGFYERLGFERAAVAAGNSNVRPSPVPMWIPLERALLALVE